MWVLTFPSVITKPPLHQDTRDSFGFRRRMPTVICLSVRLRVILLSWDGDSGWKVKNLFQNWSCVFLQVREGMFRMFERDLFSSSEWIVIFGWFFWGHGDKLKLPLLYLNRATSVSIWEMSHSHQSVLTLRSFILWYSFPISVSEKNVSVEKCIRKCCYD